ncbi:hypothetical protein [Mycolicibacterium komossense]|uniref:Uncharacterized protein n=1 Tax=Mycolicibacterium komossense TaxID=1779 RepID=A0ABT3CFP0_9MYCO|nr:hypothetical protein [Mycolicibacterium komossense]MCV7228236.1 hypothetical protein [Mycolicibacterium komossense]
MITWVERPAGGWGNAVVEHRLDNRGRSIPWLATGVFVGFAAAGGIAAALGGTAATPVTVSGIQLASTEYSLIPLSPDTSSTDTDFWLLSGHGSIDQAAASSADRIAAVQAASPVVGPGGWLIGNGLDAASNCTGNACNGGNGGLLGGNGGNGANGGACSSATAATAATAFRPPTSPTARWPRRPKRAATVATAAC